MNQRDLDRQVAEALGESVTIIAQRGFTIQHAIPFEVEREPLVVDWDELDANR